MLGGDAFGVELDAVHRRVGDGASPSTVPSSLHALAISGGGGSGTASE